MAATDNFKCAPVFKMLSAQLESQGAQLVKKINGIYCFKVQLCFIAKYNIFTLEPF